MSDEALAGSSGLQEAILPLPAQLAVKRYLEALTQVDPALRCRRWWDLATKGPRMSMFHSPLRRNGISLSMKPSLRLEPTSWLRPGL